MNGLSRHIEILLLDNDCVIVPELGGFVAHYKPAAFIEETGLFSPPQRTLGFNVQLQLNDSLLVQSYVETYDISYPEALTRIEAEVAMVKDTLHTTGEYEFHGIGVLTLQADGNYEFTPCLAGLLTPSLFALNSFDFPIIRHVSRPSDDNETITPTTYTPGATTITADSRADENKAAERRKATVEISLTTLRNIAAAAVILLLFIFSSIPAGIGSSQLMKSAIIDTDIIKAFMEKNSSVIMQGKWFSDTTLAAEAAADNAIDMEAETTTDLADSITTAPEKHFTIVLASKVSRQGAQNFINLLERSGLDKASIKETPTVRRVVYDAFATEEEARDTLRQLRGKSDVFTEAWVAEI